MKIFAIFGQRKCSYPGEYGPEILDAIDENSYELNPDWIFEKLEAHRKDSDMATVAMVTIVVDTKVIDKALSPFGPETTGSAEPFTA